MMKLVTAVSLAIGLVLAACAPAPSAPAAAPTQAAPAATSPAAGAPAVSGKPAAAPVTITFWHGMNGTEPGTQGGTLKELVDQYKQVAPNVTINLDFTPYTANELQQKVTDYEQTLPRSNDRACLATPDDVRGLRDLAPQAEPGSDRGAGRLRKPPRAGRAATGQ